MTSPLLLGLVAAVVTLLLRPPALRWVRLPHGLELGRRRVRPAARRSAELEWVESLVAELRAGRDPRTALEQACASLPLDVVPSARAAARAGADVVPALLVDGARSELLRGCAACWEVAQGSGAGLAAALVTLADAARETERVRRELHAGLAEPRATALVLAGLPVVGLLMGVALGADPLAWLLGSVPGRAVLLAGAGFEIAGGWWAWRIATRLEAEL